MARIESFDGIRGFAVLLVVFHHFNSLLGVRSAQLGVDLFLVLSGFLITSLLMSELDRTGKISFGQFFAKRALRLIPALLVTIFLFGVLAPILGYGRSETTAWSALWSLLYVSNWVRSLELMDLGQFAHTWTLSMEEQFYLLWPVSIVALCKVLPRYRACIVAALAMIVLCQATLLISVGLFGQTVWVSSSFPTRAGALFLGALSALLLQGGYLNPLQRGVDCLSFACAAIVVAIAIAPGNYFVWKQPVAIFSSAVIIVSLAKNGNPLLASLLEFRWLTYIGRISYGVYLYNFPIAWFGSFIFSDPGITPVAKQAYAAFILLPATMLLSWASYRFIEAPALRLKDRISTGIDLAPTVRLPVTQAK